jgi:hypothetical protein
MDKFSRLVFKEEEIFITFVSRIEGIVSRAKRNRMANDMHLAMYSAVLRNLCLPSTAIVTGIKKEVT